MKIYIYIHLLVLGLVGGFYHCQAKENLIASETHDKPDIRTTEYKYDLSICVIFQNEAPYLKEWIEYHKLLGVQHFYCFNNLSTDQFLEVLKPYIQDGTVELHEIPAVAKDRKTYYAMQCKCYTDCTQAAQGFSKWIAFIDPDEFLLPVQNVLLTDFLEDYADYGGVAANWVLFGTSNLKKIPEDKLLIESLLLCSEKSYPNNRFVKSIVRPERVSHFESAHQPIYRKGYAGVNTDKFSFEGDKSYVILWNKLRVNHYWTRDEDFFYKIKVPRHIIWGGEPNPELLFSYMNATKDDLILRYVPKLKKRVKG